MTSSTVVAEFDVTVKLMSISEVEGIAKRHTFCTETRILMGFWLEKCTFLERTGYELLLATEQPRGFTEHRVDDARIKSPHVYVAK